MQKNENEEVAVHLPDFDESFDKNDPSKICHNIQSRMISFISDIEKLLRNPSVKEDVNFLQKTAHDIIALENLSSCTGCCSENIIEAGELIHNLITDKIAINIGKTIYSHPLELAKDYLQNNNETSFQSLIVNFLKNKEKTLTFIKQLKVLAFDINSEV